MTIHPNHTSESSYSPDQVISLSPQNAPASHSSFDSFNSTETESDTIADQMPEQYPLSSDKPDPNSPDDSSHRLNKTAELIIDSEIILNREEASTTNKILEQQLLLEKKALQGLARCVKGFTMQEVKRTYEPGPDDEPRLKSEVITRKTIAPNLDAILFTLANLAPERWQIKPSGNNSKNLNTSPSKNNFTETRPHGNNSSNNNNSNLSDDNNSNSAERPLDLSSLSDAALEELSHLPEWPADPSELSADYPSTTQTPSLDNNSKSSTLVESLTTNASSMRFETSITTKQYQRPTRDQATQQYHLTDTTHPEIHVKALSHSTETQPNKTQHSFTDCMLALPSNFTPQNNVKFIQSSTPCPAPRSYSNEATASARKPYFYSTKYSPSRSFIPSPSNQFVQPICHATPKTTTPFRNLVHTANTPNTSHTRKAIQPNTPFCSTPTAPTKESQTNRINHPKLHSTRTSPSQSGVIRTILHARILANPLSSHLLSRLGGLRKRCHQTLDHLRTASTRQITRLLHSIARVCPGDSPKYPHRHRLVQLSTRNPL